MTDSTIVPSQPVRVRFCPSPTGAPHVGMARTALFNYAFARHHALAGQGGTFVFRIEDTDAARDSEESYNTVLEVMRWCGFEWDEGVEKGGPHAPYRQSQRRAIYDDVVAQLRTTAYVYDCFCTTEEVDARRKAAGSKIQGYDGYCRTLDPAQRAAWEAEGRRAVLRFKMPEGKIGWDDLVRGEIEFDTAHVPDFAITRANGDPLYTLVNPVDDALMEISHVLRGEDLLSSTPRQIALYEALKELGIAKATPRFGHLPYVMGQGNKKLSKRDPEANFLNYVEAGFLPEGLLNYLALLGWAIAPDNDIFSMKEMYAAFDIADVNPNPARFDLKKAQAINAAHMRLLSLADLTERVIPFLQRDQILANPVTEQQRELLDRAMPLINERINNLAEAGPMLGFLFADAASLVRAETVGADGVDVVRAAQSALAAVESWDTESIDQALRAALIEGLGLKPRDAFGPVRIAVTGNRISPPLFESLELLGREESLARLDGALAAAQ